MNNSKREERLVKRSDDLKGNFIIESVKRLKSKDEIYNKLKELGIIKVIKK